MSKGHQDNNNTVVWSHRWSCLCIISSLFSTSVQWRWVTLFRTVLEGTEDEVKDMLWLGTSWYW